MVLINKLHSAHVKIAKNEAENAELKVASARTLLLIRYVMSCTNIGENDPDTSGIRAGQGTREDVRCLPVRVDLVPETDKAFPAIRYAHEAEMREIRNQNDDALKKASVKCPPCPQRESHA
eukprot:2219082-Rhodomonas_salina.2